MKPNVVQWGNVSAQVAVGVLSAWATALLLLPSSITKGSFEPFFTLAGTLVGAYVGAWAAFKLQSRHQDAQERARQRAAAVNVFVTLTQMSNRLWNIRHNLVTPYRRKPYRHFAMPVMAGHERVELVLNPADLAFLQTKGNDINFIGEVTVAGWGFQSALACVESRSQAWASLVKPRMRDFADANPHLNGDITSAAFDAFPITVELEMRQLTDAMISVVDAEIDRLAATANALGEKIAAHFPEITILHRVDLPPEELPVSPAWSDRWTSYYRRWPAIPWQLGGI